MRRRDFLQAGLTGAAAAAVTLAEASATAGLQASQATFSLDYAPHFGMFTAHAGEDLIAQLRFMHQAGFRSLEDNSMRTRPVAVQEALGNELGRLGMRMGVFVAHTLDWTQPTLTLGPGPIHDRFLKEIAESVEVAKRVNAKWVTVVPGHVDLRQEMGYQSAHVIDALRRAAEIMEPHGVIMVLEPLNWWTNHPGMFLTRSSQAFELCRAVDSPSCKILFDIYHQQITEGNIIPNIDRCWSEVAYIQIGDNPGRKEPTTGEINYPNILRHIRNVRGFRGVLGMEHGNSRPGIEGERAVIDAYRQVDPGA